MGYTNFSTVLRLKLYNSQSSDKCRVVTRGLVSRENRGNCRRRLTFLIEVTISHLLN